MQKFRAIFWDNDGILVDTEPLYARAIQMVFDRIGYKKDAEEIYLRLGITKGVSWWSQVQEEMGFSDEERKKLRKEAYANYGKIITKKKDLVISGVREILENLHQDVPMAIVTSSSKENFDILHQNTDLLEFFDFVLTREDFEHSKPNPECYYKALEKLQGNFPDVQAEECLVVEDSERGIVAAKEAGMTTWAIPTDFTRDLDFSRADKVLGSVKELYDFL